MQQQQRPGWRQRGGAAAGAAAAVARRAAAPATVCALLLSVLLLAGGVRGRVIDITDDNFDALTKEGDWFIDIFAPWWVAVVARAWLVRMHAACARCSVVASLGRRRCLPLPAPPKTLSSPFPRTKQNGPTKQGARTASASSPCGASCRLS